MPFPGDLTTRTVTGTFRWGNGAAQNGFVTFTPSTDLVDAAGKVIVPALAVTGTLYAGSLSVSLLCTDNAGISPSGWYWIVTVYIAGGPARTPYNVLIATGAGSVDLASLAPVTPGPAVSTLYGVLAAPTVNTWHSSQVFDGAVDIEGGLTFGGIAVGNPPNDSTKFLTGAGTWVSAGGASGALLAANNLSDLVSAAAARTNLGLGSAATLAAGAVAQTANNLSDLVSASTARTNLGLGSAATANVGTGAGTVAAGNDSRITGALQAANNLSDLASAGAARTNLGLGSAALLASSAVAQSANNLSDLASVSTARTNLGLGSAALLASSAVAQTANNLSDLASASTARTNLGLGSAATLATGAVAQTANNLSDLASAAAARTNLGLGTQAQQNAGSAAGVLAEMLPAHQCAVSGGSTLTAAVLILNLIRPLGPILVTNLGIWLTTAGVTANGANGLALYTAAGVLIDQTADLSTAFASTGYVEAALSGGTQQLAANTAYYVGVLTHFSGTTPRAAAAVAGQAIPVIKGNYLSLTKSATATFPASFTPSALTTSTAAYYMAMT